MGHAAYPSRDRARFFGGYGPELPANETESARMLEAAAWMGFLAIVLCPIAWIDARHQVIPDVLNLALAAGGLAYSSRQGAPALYLAVVGALVTLAVLLAVRAVYHRRRGRQGLGMGDVKLFTASALWVGPFGISWLVLAACASALATALALRLSKRPVKPTTRLPFGPHIALGLAIV